MTTDTKCGLFIGVAFVIAVAVLFFQKEPETNAKVEAKVTKTVPGVNPNRSPNTPSAAAMLPSGPLPRPNNRELEGTPTSRTGRE
jgi:hypothetical protein